VLSGDISIDHRGSERLLRDIHATYKWLDGHAEEARPWLLQHIADDIFLNLELDDLDTPQPWIWKSATQLVLNLPYDNDDRVSVRDFLYPFRSLLVAAGVQELSDPTYASTTHGVDDGALQIRLKFNTMREVGKLTDVTLVPKPGESEIREENLRAHKAFLAAAVPHLDNAFSSGMAEATSDTYPFDGSAFGACAFIGKDSPMSLDD
jgi:hypothetical protein